MLVLLIHRSGSSSSSDGAEAEAGFPPASSSSSILVYGAYLAVLVLLVLLFVLVILCRKRRDDATPASSLIPTLDLHSSKLWIGPTNPTSPSPFPPSPPPYSQPSPQQLQLISRHNHLLLLLASNFCRSLPWDCGLVQGLADIGHRSRRYYAEISDAKVDAEMGGGAAVQCMMCVVDVSGLDVVDYSGLKRFSQMRSLLLSLQHPNVLPVYNAHWLPAAASSSSSSPTSFSSSSVAVAAPSASPHCIFVTPLSPHGSLRDHLTSALCSHPYATKYFTAASQHRRGSPLPLRHVRAFTRQLISGLLYLRSRGIVMYHLHSGNVLLMREEGGRGVRCLLAGVEGVLLGLKGRLHRKVKRLRHVDPVLSSLALLVYEMCTGVEAEVRERAGGAEGEGGGGQDQSELMRIGNREYADADDFIALILHAAHTVTLEELLSHRLCSQQSSTSPSLPPQPSPPSASSDGKLVRKVLLPVHRYYVLEVYRRLPHTVADGLWYAREGGWGETAEDGVEGREREGGGKKKKKDRDREQQRDRSRHDRALIV